MIGYATTVLFVFTDRLGPWTQAHSQTVQMGWSDGRWTDRRSNRRTVVWMDRWTDGGTECQKDSRMDAQSDG